MKLVRNYAHPTRENKRYVWAYYHNPDYNLHCRIAFCSTEDEDNLVPPGIIEAYNLHKVEIQRAVPNTLGAKYSGAGVFYTLAAEAQRPLWEQRNSNSRPKSKPITTEALLAEAEQHIDSVANIHTRVNLYQDLSHARQLIQEAHRRLESTRNYIQEVNPNGSTTQS